MNFTELKILIEKNIYYKLPKDKEEQLYDFYLLTYLDELAMNVKNPSVHQLGSDIESSLSDATKTITDELQVSLMRAIEFAVAAEFRHIFDNNDAVKLKKFFDKYGEKKFFKDYAIGYKVKSTFGDVFDDREREEITDRFKDNSRGYQDSYKALKKTKIPTSKLMEMASDAFKNLNWAKGFGGLPWSRIAEGWLMLDKAKSYKDKVIAIDHAYDLQHNTNTVFNKLKSYYKDGYRWIKNALDHKAAIKNVWELVDNASISAREIAGFVAHGKGWGSLELFQSQAKEKKVTTDKLLKVKEFESISNDWQGGTWKTGVWQYGFWHDGTWEDGTWKNGTWYNGTWENGTWEGGIWEYGIWKDGTWEGGTWNFGTWEKGWILDKKREGNYEPTWKWKGDYVESPINPKEYFAK